ncbi:MAG: helix-turn-helix domain-containing protein [Chloroflexota bacterium]|nr:helix-turn-helix domain-containing protein [Chloroflexota bacterium]
MLAGRLDGVSLARLAHFLTLLGQDVEVVVREKPASREVGRLSLVSA